MNFSTLDEAVVVDVETTGRFTGRYGFRIEDSQGVNRVIEVAALRVDFGRLEFAPDFACYKYYLVDPRRDSSDVAFEKHRIRRSDVDKKCPLFESIASEIREFIGDYPIVAHNARFDCNFLSYEFDRAGVATLGSNKKFCTMERFEELYLEEYCTLDRASEMLGVQGRESNTHGAMEDVMIALKIACELRMIDANTNMNTKIENRKHLSRLEDKICHLYRTLD